MRRAFSSKAVRSVVGFSDQAVSSLTNALALICAARVASVEQFAGVAVGYAVFVGFLGLSRGLLGTSIVLESGFSARLKAEISFALPVSCALAGVASASVLAVGLLQGLGWAGPVLAMGAFFAIIQDVLRFWWVAEGAPFVSLASDLAWLLLVSVGLVVPGWEAAEAAGGLGFWLLGSFVALTVALIPALRLVRIRFPLGLWAESKRLRLANAYDQGLGAISSALTVGVMAVLAGPELVAAIRGASTLMGPFALLYSAIPLVVIPLLARGGSGRAWVGLTFVAVCIAFVAGGIGVVGGQLPSSIGERFLGESWAGSSAILPVLGIEYAGLAFYHLAMTYLRVSRLSRAIWVTRTVFTLATLLSAVILAPHGEAMLVAAGAAGVAWAIPLCIGLVALWKNLRSV